MIKRVAWLLKKNSKVLSEQVAALEELIEDFTQTVESMDELYRSFEFKKTNRQTVTKKTAKAKLIASTLRLLNAVRAYAFKKDAEMLAGKENLRLLFI